jgi:bifunctional oligoribonuclease and PAP phosphatase NrnA
MQCFDAEFRNLGYVVKKSDRILLIAHSRPDPDTVGSNVALCEYLESQGKKTDIACYDFFPEIMKGLSGRRFVHPDHVDFDSYDAIIACDSVDRGFDKMIGNVSSEQVVVLIDHHPDIELEADIRIVDVEYSSASELVYLFLESVGALITKSMASLLLSGILFDTGSFQHSNVTPRVMEIASCLVKKGAPLQKITQTIFSNQDVAALRLWGKAFEKAKLNPLNGMIMTAVTKKDVEECGASADDIYQVTSILSTVPDARFALVLSERDHGMIRASLRSTDCSNFDVSDIAKRFGGGGHRLASGFELPGRIIETESGFMVV